MQDHRLVEMANQIADFFAPEPDRQVAATETASHIRRFWDPRMRRQILAYAKGAGTGLNPVAAAAVAMLARDAAPPPPRPAARPGPRAQA